MGGNALKNTFTRRYEREEYFELEEEVMRELHWSLGRTHTLSVRPIKAYRKKESFGDMDLLVESYGLSPLWKETIRTKFEPNEMVSNGNCLSFDYKELQIDLIITPTNEMNTSELYFSYNDLGNLMGRVAHKFGLKYGHDGMYYIMRDGGTGRKDILLTKDPRRMFDILGFDYDRYLEGFDTLDDIFKFVMESKYFNPNIYLYDNLNHQSRTRDRKRATYHAFTLECEEIKNYSGFYQFDDDKSVYLLWLFKEFPCEAAFFGHHRDGLERQYVNILKDFDWKRKVKEKFSGKDVMEWTSLTGKDLGQLMTYIKPHFTDGVIMSQSKERLKKLVWKLEGEWRLEDGTR